MLPLAVLGCVVFGGATVVSAEVTSRPESAREWWAPVSMVGLFPLANACFIYTSTKHGRWRLWPLGIATVAGAAVGVWFCANLWDKAREPGPWAPGTAVWLGLGWLALTWVVAALVVMGRGRA